MIMRFVCLVLMMLLASMARAELLGEEWITEAEMRKQSAFARQHNLVLVELNCRFRDGVASPGRADVLFRADFKQSKTPIPWGWTFDANRQNDNAEAQARKAGFVVASEDYYEITGVTWVQCKIWRVPSR